LKEAFVESADVAGVEPIEAAQGTSSLVGERSGNGAAHGSAF
jgi:hypothetical protein